MVVFTAVKYKWVERRKLAFQKKGRIIRLRLTVSYRKPEVFAAPHKVTIESQLEYCIPACILPLEQSIPCFQGVQGQHSAMARGQKGKPYIKKF